MTDSQHSSTVAADGSVERATSHESFYHGAIGRWAIRFGRTIYTHNPFYVASAWMVFSGLRASFPVSSTTMDSWLLTLCLMGYTLLLSVTAILVIRLGKVWDDARSLLLLVVLMLLGISVTFDGILAESPDQASRYYVCGWIFAAAISEVLLRSLPLRLGLLFRVPFHLLLALEFLYPLVLRSRLTAPADPMLAWQFFGFPLIAAAIFLSLIPAVRRGPSYVADNGSPWQWPWYPWVLIGMLGFCVSLRSYYLCVSLHFVHAADTIFAPYFLVPLGLAATLLLLEAGLAIGSRRCLRFALCVPALLVLMASTTAKSDAVNQAFLRQFEQTMGAAPLVVTLWIVAAFYALAVMRSVVEANYPLIVTLVLLSLAPARLAGTGMDPVPLAMAGAWQIAVGWRLGRSGDVVIGSCCSLLAAMVAGRGAWFVDSHGILPAHALLAILLAAGYWYQDRTGHYARRAAVALAVALSLYAALGNPSVLRDINAWSRAAYPMTMAVLLAGYSRATGDAWSYVGSAAAAAVGCSVISLRAYGYLHDHIAGLRELAWGALFFLFAALISLIKSPLRIARLRRRSP